MAGLLRLTSQPPNCMHVALNRSMQHLKNNASNQHCTVELHDFTCEDSVPPYAILSHTWEDQEVTFQDMQSRDPNGRVTAMKGYHKIEQCCHKALQKGIDWAWVDTCCIDKSSSAELSEAINSMYRWYQNADICYAFLSDVTSASYRAGHLGRSRWFTRGWTLQELIAPREVIFFSSDWNRLSTKTQLKDKLEIITGVPKVILVHQEHVSRTSVAMRMSWAANRETKRIEDMAYCLMGLFDINMPLIYGEGQKAFRRLQEEIVRTQPYEHTIYAWGTLSIFGKDPLPVEFTTLEGACIDSKAMPLRAKITWQQEIAQQPFLGMLATSPADFEGCGRFVPSPEAQRLMTSSWQEFFPPIFMHGGMRIRLRVWEGQTVHHLLWPPLLQLRDTLYACLLVRDSSIDEAHRVVIPIMSWLTDVWGRKFKAFVVMGQMDLREDELFVAPEKKFDGWPRAFHSGDIILRWPLDSERAAKYGHTLLLDDKNWRFLPGKRAFVRQGAAQTLNDLHPTGWVASWIWKVVNSCTSWCIIMHRVPDRTRRRWGALAISLARVRTQATNTPTKERPSVLEPRSYKDTVELACCSYVMRDAVEVWRPDAPGLPRGTACCVESMTLADGKSHIDVVDFRYPDGCGDTHIMVPRAEWS